MHRMHSFYISVVFFYVSLLFAYDFSNLRILICLQDALNHRIYCHGYVLTATSEGTTCFHDSTELETVVLWCLVKYNCALKSHSNVKIHINYRLSFCKHNGTF